MRSKNIRIRLEELSNEALEGDEVYVWVGVKKLEVDLDATLRLCFAAHFFLFVSLFSL